MFFFKCYFVILSSQFVHVRLLRVLNKDQSINQSLWRFVAEIAAIRRLYIGLRWTKLYIYMYIKNIVVLVWLEPPTRRSRSKSAHKCIPYNNRCVQNFTQIGWDLAVRGPKTCFGVKTERPSLYAWPSTRAEWTSRQTVTVDIATFGRRLCRGVHDTGQ